MPTINMKKTGQKIADMISDKGFTIKVIQNIFGFNQPTAIYKWVHGTAMPTLDNMIILADIFGCRVDDILVIDKVHK